MVEQKTKPTVADPAEFVAGLNDPAQRADSAALIQLMREVTGEPPVMWGPNIVGFGRFHYRYASGHQGDTFVLGFAPRKQNLTLYLPGHLDQYTAVLDGLGKYRTGKGCLYLKRLSDVEPTALHHVLEAGVRQHRAVSRVAAEGNQGA